MKNACHRSMDYGDFTAFTTDRVRGISLSLLFTLRLSATIMDPFLGSAFTEWPEYPNDGDLAQLLQIPPLTIDTTLAETGLVSDDLLLANLDLFQFTPSAPLSYSTPISPPVRMRLGMILMASHWPLQSPNEQPQTAVPTAASPTAHPAMTTIMS